MPPPQQLGLYISVPFCRAKCSFCNFASGVSSPATIDRYIDLLCAEILSSSARTERLGVELPLHVDTVYFGGGTPSLLTPSQLDRIFAALHAQFVIDPAAEITLEAAPNQISPEFLDHALHLGVNRVSLGVQSFVDRESTAVGRSHTREDCITEIRRLHSAGIRQVAADLIAGLPYQTAETWQHSLDTAAQLATEGALTHLSVYMLEIDEDSRLGREVLNGGARLHAPAVASDDLAASLYEHACNWLPAHSFAQYEISNFGHASRHNLKYWTRAPYLGFGLDAHSMLPPIRFANADDLADYDGLSRASQTALSQRDAFEESLFLGLRLTEGLSPQDLSEFPHDWVSACVATVAELTQEGLMTTHDDRWQLTLRGRLISNEIFGRLLELVAA